jgi:hypothetical protein
MWLFIILFIYVIYKGINFDFSSVTYLDSAIFCGCIASVGGITGAIVTKYYNNSNAENIPRIQLKLFRESTQIRLEYNEKMLELRNKYHASENDVMEIENESHMDEVSENILSNAIAELETKATNSHEDVDVQNY